MSRSRLKNPDEARGHFQNQLDQSAGRKAAFPKQRADGEHNTQTVQANI